MGAEEGPQQKIADFISGLSEQRLDPDWDHNHPSTPTCERLGPVSLYLCLTCAHSYTLAGADLAQGFLDLLRVCLSGGHLHTISTWVPVTLKQGLWAVMALRAGSSGGPANALSGV